MNVQSACAPCSSCLLLVRTGRLNHLFVAESKWHLSTQSSRPNINLCCRTFKGAPSSSLITMPRNQKGDGKRIKNGRPVRGCPRCGSKRYSSGKWCPCDGFLASGQCGVCGEKRIGGCKKPGHPTYLRRMKKGKNWPVSTCRRQCKGDAKINRRTKGKGSRKQRTNHFHSANSDNMWCFPIRTPNEEECPVCGCNEHVDDVGDQICWCDACDQMFDWEASWKPIWRDMEEYNGVDGVDCEICGCSEHVDEVGDRKCWCDACHSSVDWVSCWSPIWRNIDADTNDMRSKIGDN